jgi:hypothetical protein
MGGCKFWRAERGGGSEGAGGGGSLGGWDLGGVQLRCVMSMARRARGGVRSRWFRSCCLVASTSKDRGRRALVTPLGGVCGCTALMPGSLLVVLGGIRGSDSSLSSARSASFNAGSRTLLTGCGGCCCCNSGSCCCCC